MYVADFETTTDPGDCRVWAWAVCDVYDETRVAIGNDIGSFMRFVVANPDVYYFHNLAFDGEFIVSYLLSNGYAHVERLVNRSFSTLISDTGKWYQLEVCFKRNGRQQMNRSVFRDSLKKLPMSVANVAKSFDLPISKLEIDYDEARPEGHELTDEERAYVVNDVRIVACALREQLDQGLDAMTVGSDALKFCKGVIGRKWANMFPELTVKMDSWMRKAYRGGYTFANPEHAVTDEDPMREVGTGNVYDVNSMYPSVMSDESFPAFMPVHFDGRYVPDPAHPLFIQYVTVACKLRDGFFPILQIKKNPFYVETEYISDTEGYVELALTNVDLEMLDAHYELDILSYNGGFKFRSVTGVFDEYIAHWMGVKETTTGGKRQIAKLMLNSLYGKFATNPIVRGKEPFLREDDAVGYRLTPEDERKPVYTPVGVFVTSYARRRIQTAVEAVHERFCYCDTDSIHLIGDDPVSGMDVHPTRLGAWKHESTFSRARYVRAKTYIERITHVGKMVDGVYGMHAVEPYDDVKCAGLPSYLHGEVGFDNFRRGLVVAGKLMPSHVKGGIVLVERDFTVR